MIQNTGLRYADYIPETSEEEYALLVGRVEAAATYVDNCCHSNTLIDGNLLLMMLGTQPMDTKDFLKTICPF